MTQEDDLKELQRLLEGNNDMWKPELFKAEDWETYHLTTACKTSNCYGCPYLYRCMDNLGTSTLIHKEEYEVPDGPCDFECKCGLTYWRNPVATKRCPNCGSQEGWVIKL